MSEQCPKCGSKYSMRLSGVKYECESVMFSGGQFFQSKLCKANIRLTDLQTKLDKAREALRQIASDKTEFCYHGRFAAKTLDEVK